MLQVQVVQYMITVSQWNSPSPLLLPPSSKTKVIIKIKVQSYEKGYLEVYHSDRCGHTDRHRHQPWSYQLYVMGESTPSPSPKEGN